MNNEEICQTLSQVRAALESISVAGKSNLANLCGSIGLIDTLLQKLAALNEQPQDE